MSTDQPSSHPTLALNTKVEDDFVSPLTAVRGSLEILRDFPELAETERLRFVETALRGCAKLEISVEQLASTVYAAGERALPDQKAPESLPDADGFSDRVHVLEPIDIMELDLSDYEFRDSSMVNEFYDAVDAVVAATGRDWYLLVNNKNCHVWPEAWVAFAHRGKKANAAYSLGTVRYDDSEDEAKLDRFDPYLFETRELALAKIEELKLEQAK